MKVTIYTGNITHFDGDAIVNAAKPSLLGGGGVDGAIHQAAGPHLAAACFDIHDEGRVRCAPGRVRPTPGFGVNAPWIFHTVGPDYRLDDPDSLLYLAGLADIESSREQLADEEHRRLIRETLLHRCFLKCLELANALDLRTLAFPAISAGVYGAPMADVARIAFDACRVHQRGSRGPEVYICLFHPHDLDVWEKTAQRQDEVQWEVRR